MISLLFLFLVIIAYCVAVLMLTDNVKRPIDYKYDAKITFVKEEFFVSLSYHYDIQVTDKKTGVSKIERHVRYPDIYKDEASWARMRSRGVYNNLLSSIKPKTPGQSFNL